MLPLPPRPVAGQQAGQRRHEARHNTEEEDEVHRGLDRVGRVRPQQRLGYPYGQGRKTDLDQHPAEACEVHFH